MYFFYDNKIYLIVVKNGGNIMEITKPCLCSRGGIIIKANKEFIDFIGFTIDELLGKSLHEIGDMIRINTQIYLDNISGKYFGYVFTKSLSAKIGRAHV